MSTLSPDDILGKYRIVRLLGQGGMAEVYLARHRMLRNRVALKVLPKQRAANQDMVSRFLREARAAARLRHPHITRIHDVDCIDGVNYFAMDYVEGRTLGRVIASDATLDQAAIVELSRQVLSALGAAHAQGIVHRDIKPDNIIIDGRGQAVVTDFGIAHAAGQDRITTEGSFLGTVYYASPEQVQGRPVDARGDLYAWGVVMFEMATGQAPFTGQSTAAVLYQHVHQPPAWPDPPPPTISPGLRAVIDKALAKDPEERFASAAEMRAALEQLGADRGPAGAATTQRRRTMTTARRARRLLKQAQAMAEKEQWVSVQALAEKALSLDGFLVEGRQLLSLAEKELARDERVEQLTAEAEACLSQEAFQEAATLIEELAGISRDRPAALAWLAQVRSLAGQAPEPNLEPEPDSPEPAAAAEPPARRRRWPWALAGAAALAAVLGGVLFLYAGRPAPQAATTRSVAAPTSRPHPGRSAQAVRQAELGRRLLQEGDLTAAARAFQAARRLDPELPAARRGLLQVERQLERNRQARALVAAGDQQARAGNFAPASRQWMQALELDPRCRPATRKLANLGWRMALLRRRQEDQRRREAARRARQQGVEHLRQHRYQEAVDKLQQYQAVFPSDAQVERLLAQARRGLASRGGRARQKARTGEDLRMGRQHLRAGRFNQALARFNAVLAARPGDARAKRLAAEARRRKQAATSGELRVGCLPPADLWLDGRYLGRTPQWPTGIAPGRHQVRVSAFGAVAQKTVVVPKGRTAEAVFQLTGGKLTVVTKPWAKVYLDGRHLGFAPGAWEDLRVGAYTLEIRRKGFRTEKIDLVIRYGPPGTRVERVLRKP